jgi:hypothetical protein
MSFYGQHGFFGDEEDYEELSFTSFSNEEDKERRTLMRKRRQKSRRRPKVNVWSKKTSCYTCQVIWHQKGYLQG